MTPRRNGSRARKHDSLEARLFAHVEMEPMSGCWIWIGARKEKEHGRIRYLGDELITSRAAWIAWRGPIPGDSCVLHRCDTPPCINPAHLFLGTVVENNADMVAKGRWNRARGEMHPRAKLTEAQVAEIRANYRVGGVSQRELALAYGIDKSVMCRLLNRQNWTRVA